jgi:hypothetical protein
MESPVSGVIVFGLTLAAHPENLHGGMRPVIGNVVDDGVSRTAVRAVDERVVITTIGRFKKLIQTVTAYTHVR